MADDEQRAALTDQTNEWLTRLAATLNHRELEQRTIDAHGDLRLEHLYSGPVIAVLDPIEGGPEARRMDSGLDFASLCVSLDQIDPHVSQQAQNTYARLTLDATLSKIMPLFKRIRAFERARWLLHTASLMPANLRPPVVQNALRLTTLGTHYKLTI